MSSYSNVKTYIYLYCKDDSDSLNLYHMVKEGGLPITSILVDDDRTIQQLRRNMSHTEICELPCFIVKNPNYKPDIYYIDYEMPSNTYREVAKIINSDILNL